MYSPPLPQLRPFAQYLEQAKGALCQGSALTIPSAGMLSQDNSANTEQFTPAPHLDLFVMDWMSAFRPPPPIFTMGLATKKE